MSDDHDTGAGRYDWERIVRRVRLGPGTATKVVALILATYADADGTHVRPGQQRLAASCEISDRAVRDALRKLEDIGLIECVTKGGRHGQRGYADEYRLTIPADLLDRVELLPVDERPCGQTPVEPVGRRPQPEPRFRLGTIPNRNSATSQPELSDSQPELSDVPTGTPVPPTNPRPTTNQPTDQRDHPVDDATTDRAGDGDVVDIFVRMAQRDRFR